MGAGPMWTEAEDDLIRKLVALGRVNRQIYEAHKERFGGRSFAAVAKRRAELGTVDLPEPDEEIRREFPDDDTLEVRVVSAGKIQTVEDLRAAAEVDLDVWEEYEADVRNRYVPMKDADGDPIVIETRYIKIRYRRKAATFFDLTPAVLKIVKPRVRKPGKSTTDISIHFADTHYPHDNPANMSVLHQVIEMVQPTVLIDQGDTLDCEQISRYPKDPIHRTSLREEIDMARQHFGGLSSLVLEDCRKIWLEGNHEERKRRVIWELADKRAAGELLTLPTVREALEWRNLLCLGQLGWEDYPYKSERTRPNKVVLYDKLICKHGASTGKNVAEKEYEKYGKSGISGHMHRFDVHHRRDWNGQHAWHVMGMMGMIRDDYTDHANWQNGFCVVTWSKSKDRFAFEPIQIIDGECYFRGVHLTGDSLGSEMAA